MKKLLILACVLAMGSFAIPASAGCGTCAADAKKKDAAASCAKCGEAKGSDKCCKEGVEKCAKCGLNAGSAGCKAKCAAKAEAAK